MDKISELLKELSQKKKPLWQQMCTIEILSAVLAEQLMSNGTKINLDPEEITWPDGTVTKPPSHEKKGKGRKKNPNSKHGMYGRIVHEYGPKATVSKQDLSNMNQTVVINKEVGQEDNAEPSTSTGCRNGN